MRGLLLRLGSPHVFLALVLTLVAVRLAREASRVDVDKGSIVTATCSAIIEHRGNVEIRIEDSSHIRIVIAGEHFFEANTNRLHDHAGRIVAGTLAARTKFGRRSQYRRVKVLDR